LPVKSNEEGISRYVGKYVSKHIGQREERDKGIRLVEYTRGARVGSTAFAWNNFRSTMWRSKVAHFAKRHGCETYGQLVSLFGPHWAYHHREAILREDWEVLVPNWTIAKSLGLPPDAEIPGVVSSTRYRLPPDRADWDQFTEWVEQNSGSPRSSVACIESTALAAPVVPPEASPERPGCGAEPSTFEREAPRRYTLPSRHEWGHKTLRPRQHVQRALDIRL
jgi:hypothetical protein